MNNLSPLGIQWVERYRPNNNTLREHNYLIAKRVMDLVVVITTLPFWLPLVGLIALVIKISSPRGPVLFNQLRTGKNGKRFLVFKFRTMVTNAEDIKGQLNELNVLKWPDFKIPDDPRVTRIGRILRKTSLDEIPQLFNVLKGDMSLVGPRPTSFGPDTYSLWETERLEVVPGMTGLWQICDRGRSEFDSRSRLDIIYIERRCITMDIEIFLRTIEAVFKQRGAY